MIGLQAVRGEHSRQITPVLRRRARNRPHRAVSAFGGCSRRVFPRGRSSGAWKPRQRSSTGLSTRLTTKSIDKVVALLQVLGCDVEMVVRSHDREESDESRRGRVACAD